MPSETINKQLVKRLAKTAAPAKEVRYFDTQLAAFHVRHLPSGATSYGVKLSREKSSVSLGSLASWKDPKLARAAALEAIRKFRAGETVTARSARPQAKAAAGGMTIGQLFGLRQHFNGGVALPGLFRASNVRIRDHAEVALDRFVLHVGVNRPLAAITQDDCQAFVDGLLQQRKRNGSLISSVSVEGYLALVRSAFTWSIKKRFLAGANPAKGLHIQKRKEDKDKAKRTRWLFPEEEQLLREVLRARDLELRSGQPTSWRRSSPRLRTDGCRYADYMTPLVLLALSTGGRKGALRQLRWYHIERLPFWRICFEGKYQKAGQTYYVPLSDEAREILKAWRPKDAADSDLVFPGMKGQPFNHTMDLVWRKILAVAGIRGFRFHDLRHTFASVMVQEGEQLKVVSELLGHKSVRMTERYSHLAPNSGVSAVERIAKRMARTPQPQAEPAAA